MPENASPDDKSVEQTLACFRKDAREVFGGNLFEIVIHGSYALGDFTPHKGDLDYAVAVENDLDDAAIARWIALHEIYRREKKLLLYQLEGTVYPRRVIADPGLPFVGACIGTGRKGWGRISAFKNSFIDLLVMEHYGLKLFKKQLVIYRPGAAQIRAEQSATLQNLTVAIDREGSPGIGFLYALIHWCARTMVYAGDAAIVSKSEACRRCLTERSLAEFSRYAAARDQRYPYAGDRIPIENAVMRCRSLLEVTRRSISGAAEGGS